MERLALQLDFDGTVTEEDISYILLDEYAGDRWRPFLKEYTERRMTVGAFSKKVFGMIRADIPTMTEFVLRSRRVRIRPGFHEMIEWVRQHGIRLVIVSNGLKFYITAILGSLGLDGLEVHAAECLYSLRGLKVKYVGPDGKEIDDGFKEAYTRWLKNSGYEVIYVGDGASDIYPGRLAARVFATGTLLELCRQEGLDCTPFRDLRDIIRGLEAFKKG